MFGYRTGGGKGREKARLRRRTILHQRQKLTPPTELRDWIPTCGAQQAGTQPTLTPDSPAPSGVQLTSASARTLGGHTCLGMVCGRPGLQAPPCRWGQDGWHQNLQVGIAGRCEGSWGCHAVRAVTPELRTGAVRAWRPLPLPEKSSGLKEAGRGTLERPRLHHSPGGLSEQEEVRPPHMALLKTHGTKSQPRVFQLPSAQGSSGQPPGRCGDHSILEHSLGSGPVPVWPECQEDPAENKHAHPTACDGHTQDSPKTVSPARTGRWGRGGDVP